MRHTEGKLSYTERLEAVQATISRTPLHAKGGAMSTSLEHLRSVPLYMLIFLLYQKWKITKVRSQPN